jgi:hypothetical protein
MTFRWMNLGSFLWQADNVPSHNAPGSTTGITQPTNDRIMNNFWEKDNLSMLGQWPIKRTPARNNKATVEKPLTDEEARQIKELFWEDYDQVNF